MLCTGTYDMRALVGLCLMRTRAPAYVGDMESDAFAGESVALPSLKWLLQHETVIASRLLLKIRLINDRPSCSTRRAAGVYLLNSPRNWIAKVGIVEPSIRPSVWFAGLGLDAPQEAAECCLVVSPADSKPRVWCGGWWSSYSSG